MKMRWRAGAAWLGTALAAAAATADGNKIIVPHASTPAAMPNGPAGSGVLNFLTLVLALALAAAGAWLFYRNRRRIGAGRGGHSLAIDETRALGNRQYLVVASYDDRKYLLGVCPGRIDMLAPLSESARGPEGVQR